MRLPIGESKAPAGGIADEICDEGEDQDCEYQIAKH
jgi:hypothetical protein